MQIAWERYLAEVWGAGGRGGGKTSFPLLVFFMPEKTENNDNNLKNT